MRVKVPEPKPYNGLRSTKELENLLKEIKNYFQASQVPNNENVLVQ